MNDNTDQTDRTATYREAVRRNVEWLGSMLPAPDGSRGIWERLRLQRDEVVFWVRPDCTAETLHAFARAAETLDRPELEPIARRLQAYLLDAQTASGAFPFYRWDPPISSILEDRNTQGHVRFPNDNGKVLELLALAYARELGDPERTRHAITRLADHLVANQEPDGSFRLGDLHYRGPCFLSWPVIGLARAYRITNDDRHRATALRALDALVGLQRGDGRLRTSFEVARDEDWRPASSETVEALRAFALADRLLGEDLAGPIAGAQAYLRRLTTPDGAIRNCDEESGFASLQRDPSLTDLVYTDGYALHAWLDAWRATDDPAALESARKLADFLVSIQCDAPHEVYDGAWRGSYDVDRHGWRGRADQNNPIDEGGAHSVYTGWCNATITNGLLRLIAA